MGADPETYEAESLDRFVLAQRWMYDQALDQLRRGQKTSHWMWFIFPQIVGLGHSDMALRYAIADRAEAIAYLRHPQLGSRLSACTEAIMTWTSRRTTAAMLGTIDALKFRSSMTLFEVAGASYCTKALDTLCAGERDERTLALLRSDLDHGRTQR